jgi:hypothetical protein
MKLLIGKSSNIKRKGGHLMSRQNRSRIIAGIFMILLGGWFLLVQFIPDLNDWMRIDFSWPLIIVAVGIFLLFLGLLTNEPGMAVPACVVGGIGALLYWQNATGNWGSWAYAWTLIPGFVGLGILLEGLLSGRIRSAWNSAFTLMMISLVTFMIFGSFFARVPLGDYWPGLLILWGVWLLIRVLFRSKT